MSSTTHWEAVYSGRATEDLGWYELRPSTLDLVLQFSERTDAVIDVGAGDSLCVPNTRSWLVRQHFGTR